MPKTIMFLLGWLPICAFFLIISMMFLVDFDSEIDEYFVRVVLRSVLVLLVASAIAQLSSLIAIFSVRQVMGSDGITQMRDGFKYMSTFPIVTLGVFSVAIFVRSLEFNEWIFFLSLLLVLPTIYYWLTHTSGSLKQLSDFAYYHQVPRLRRVTVLIPFFLSYFIDYFFLSLKRALLPLVFIFVVSDYRIILPRLVDAGMTYKAFLLFLSLFISLHVLSYKEDKV